MSPRTKKATFNLSSDVLTALDEAVTSGAAPSKNALVERALVAEIRQLEKRARKAHWEQAARDEVFLKDIGDIEREFASADGETAGRIES